MPSGLTPKLPLIKGNSFDYELISSYQELVRQNLKNVLLTNPGERIMDPQFGVGVQTYLFSNFSEGIQAELYDKIVDQVATYLPSVRIEKITFFESDQDTNTIAFQVYYNLKDAGLNDLLEFTI